jgi:hypothetical protein
MMVCPGCDGAGWKTKLFPTTCIGIFTRADIRCQTCDGLSGVEALWFWAKSVDEQIYRGYQDFVTVR